MSTCIRVYLLCLLVMQALTYGSSSENSTCEVVGLLGKKLGAMSEGTKLLNETVPRLRSHLDELLNLTEAHFGGRPSKEDNFTCPEPKEAVCPIVPREMAHKLPSDCDEYRRLDYPHYGTYNESGVYKIFPLHRSITEPIDVYCDMTKFGGWTVIQRRGNFGEPREDFYRDWKDYKRGFGNVTGEFWLGNDYLHVLTSQKRMSLRVDLEDFSGKRSHAMYYYFQVKSEEQNYRMVFRSWSYGNAGDSLKKSSGNFFSTKDRDNDKSTGNCAQKLKGGWWYNDCGDANPNGVQIVGSYEADEPHGIFWKTWRGDRYSLKSIEMKIRPSQSSLYVRMPPGGFP